MHSALFNDMYKNIGIPIIVCEDSCEMHIVFANTEAYLLFNPTMAVDNIGGGDDKTPLSRLLRFFDSNEMGVISQMLAQGDAIERRFTILLSADDVLLPVALTANAIRHEGQGYIVIYIYSGEAPSAAGRYNDVMAAVLNISHRATNVDRAVNEILSRVGVHINVSRVYIFEDISGNFVRNTYEWCAPGVLPAIQDLQNLSKDDISYEPVGNVSGMYITNDVSALPEKDRAVLEPQGIKALAILPLIHQDLPIGYIGYDDCENARKWNHHELTLLKGVGSVISSLIIRRNAEANILQSYNALQAISDNLDSAVYVNDVQTHELKFVNRVLAARLGVAPDALYDKKCWQVLQQGMDGPCSFCPMSELLNKREKGLDAVSEWEQQDAATGGWIWRKDSIIRWIDGSVVHFETAIDITMRKKYEEQLQYYASTDALTSVFNREWGIKILEKEHQSARMNKRATSLCFVDIDSLKKINDDLGHTAGDRAIERVSGAIRNRIRKNDDMICRWGGDEFLTLLKCDVDRADIVMQGVLADLAGDGEDAEIPALSFSYGIADLSLFENVDSAIAGADEMMYKKKQSKHKRARRAARSGGA